MSSLRLSRHVRMPRLWNERQLHCSSPRQFPALRLGQKDRGRDAVEAKTGKLTVYEEMMESLDDELDDDSLPGPGEEPLIEDEMTTLSHMVLNEERQLLKYLRLIENETPKLVGRSDFMSFVICELRHPQNFADLSSLPLLRIQSSFAL